MMQNTRKATAALAFMLTLSGGADAQRAPAASPQATQGAAASTAPKPAPAPASVKAKYEGGVTGYRKGEGTLNFDDVNHRLLFRDKLGKEQFSLPYNAVSEAWPDTKSSTSTTGRVIASTVPYGLGLPALLAKKKSRYLVIRYKDQDTGTEGLTSFRLESKEMLASVLTTLGDKADLTPRGDAYIRHK